jgi:hypothetical protein
VLRIELPYALLDLHDCGHGFAMGGLYGTA